MTGVGTELEVGLSATSAAAGGSVAMLVLDWNGTMVEDADRARDATNIVLSERGLDALDIGEFSAAFRLPLAGFFTDLGVRPADVPVVVSAWNRAMRAAPARLSGGARRLLAAARDRGIPVGIVSAAERELVLGDARALGVCDDLAFVLGSVVDKAEPLAALVAAADGPVLYVGDAEHDVEAALRAGAIPIGVATGYRPASALAAAGAVIVLADLGMLADRLASNAIGRSSD